MHLHQRRSLRGGSTRSYGASLPTKTASNGADCPLLRLPAELRNQIYGYVFEDNECCLHERAPPVHVPIGRKRAAKKRGSSPDPPPSQLPGRFGLRSTCRQIYHETKLLTLLNTTLVVRDLPA
jgi:hypothetical protein